MFFNGGILSSSEGVLFGCPGDLKVVTISEDMMLNALRKTIMNTIRGCIILLDFFTVNLFTWVMVVLNMSLWSLNATMMRVEYFSYFQNLVAKVQLNWIQLLADLQMKSLPCCTHQWNQYLIMISLLWHVINLCSHVFTL